MTLLIRALMIGVLSFSFLTGCAREIVSTPQVKPTEELSIIDDICFIDGKPLLVGTDESPSNPLIYYINKKGQLAGIDKGYRGAINRYLYYEVKPKPKCDGEE